MIASPSKAKISVDANGLAVSVSDKDYIITLDSKDMVGLAVELLNRAQKLHVQEKEKEAAEKRAATTALR
jgi:hypothetical protein